MAISFNRDSVFNLRPIDLKEIRPELQAILIGGERCVLAFQTVRDQIIFTNKRILSVDVQGITGARKSCTTLPYSKIQFFTLQTPGFFEIVSDSELFVMFSNGYTAKFDFKGDVDIGEIGRLISEYVL